LIANSRTILGAQGRLATSYVTQNKIIYLKNVLKRPTLTIFSNVLPEKIKQSNNLFYFHSFINQPLQIFAIISQFLNILGRH